MLNADSHLMQLKEAIWDVRSKWRNIGRILSLTDGDIDAIHERDDGECLHQVMSQWIHTGRATVNDLVIALESRMIGRPDIVKEIKSLIGREYPKDVTQDESCYRVPCKLFSMSRTYKLLWNAHNLFCCR